VVGLKSEIRKAVCAGLTECDLRSSQFAILAAKLDAPLSKALIAEGKNLWCELYAHTHGIDAAPPKEVKDAFKECIYSICFGKSVEDTRLFRETKPGLRTFLAERGLAMLLDHPIVRELFELRARWFAEINREGGARDVWGTWHAIKLRKDCRSGESPRLARHVAATVIQSTEMEIIAPIFDVAARYGTGYQFKIVLFQHDGATISFQAHDARKDKAKALLRKAVETRASELGVQTTLEFTDLDETEPSIAVMDRKIDIHEIIEELEADLFSNGQLRPPDCDLCGDELEEDWWRPGVETWFCIACRDSEAGDASDDDGFGLVIPGSACFAVEQRVSP
jgi:hypothetical protein